MLLLNEKLLRIYKFRANGRVCVHGGGRGNFRLAELLPAVSGACRTSQAAGQAHAERGSALI